MPTTRAIEYLGGAFRNTWTWSSSTADSSIQKPNSSAIAPNVSLTYSRMSGFPSGRHPFGRQIRWYLQSYFARLLEHQPVPGVWHSFARQPGKG